MRRRTLWAVVLSILPWTGLPAASGSGVVPQLLDEFDAKIHAELRAKSAAAESVLSEADDARNRGDHRTAARLYAKVFEIEPTFVHALRRQGHEELALGEHAKAVSLLEKAVAIDRSGLNLSGLALALVTKPADSSVSADDQGRARKLAYEAAGREPDDPFVQTVRARVAMATGDFGELDASVEALGRLAPDDVTTHYLRSLAAASHGDFDAAFASLELAHRAGLPDPAYRSLKESLGKARPLGPRLARWGAITAGAWVAGALALFVVGVALSTAALKQSERMPQDPAAGPTALESNLRRAYRVILGICCVYYYLSIPILLVLVLGLGGGLLYGLLSVGHIPIKILFFILVVTVVTGWSILKSIVVRSTDGDPGERLDLDREPALREVLVNVAALVGTRPVDTVFMTPGTDIAVFERGGLVRKLRGTSERCLILGAGALEGMRIGPFQAVLAHEYGHFSNRDTAGGGLALSVRRSTIALATNLARSGAANWYNPAWLFVNGFHRVFLRISQGASRLQEVLADRWSALLFGGKAFEEGLRHVIDRSIRFDAHVDSTLREVIDERRPLVNLYRYQPGAGGEPAALDKAVREAIEREPSPYDSHPRPIDRFRWVAALGVTSAAGPADSAPVWSLFRDRDEIERRMTRLVRNAIAAAHGVEIAAG